jgi:hypothetical protein
VVPRLLSKQSRHDFIYRAGLVLLSTNIDFLSKTAFLSSSYIMIIDVVTKKENDILYIENKTSVRTMSCVSPTDIF